MRTYTIHQVADYFRSKADPSVGDLISNLKLQKLCYYAQGVGVATRGAPLFRDDIEAWLHGPVVPSLYRTWSNFKGEALPVPENLDLSIYEEADRQLLDDVYDHYGQYSAWRLRQMTHEEPPWKDAYIDGNNNAITIEALKEYFDPQVEDTYRQKYVEEVRRHEA